MITIKVYRNGIEAYGHANYSEHGKDIVCSAVSALLQTLELRGTSIKKSGLMAISTKDKESLKLIVDGLRLIATNYSENVEVIEC